MNAKKTENMDEKISKKLSECAPYRYSITEHKPRANSHLLFYLTKNTCIVKLLFTSDKNIFSTFLVPLNKKELLKMLDIKTGGKK